MEGVVFFLGGGGGGRLTCGTEMGPFLPRKLYFTTTIASKFTRNLYAVKDFHLMVRNGCQPQPLSWKSTTDFERKIGATANFHLKYHTTDPALTFHLADRKEEIASPRYGKIPQLPVANVNHKGLNTGVSYQFGTHA